MVVYKEVYVTSPNLSNPKFHAKFRRRFRIPYDAFLKLVDDISTLDIFQRWKPGLFTYTKNGSLPIELLLIGALRYLGKGWAFDDLEVAT